MASQLGQSIVKTLAFFDVFDHPLTTEELYRLLWQPGKRMTYKEFVSWLNAPDREVLPMGNTYGFWYLKDRASLVERRQERVHIIEKKMNIARRGIRHIRWIPFLRAVFLCNTVGSSVATLESDIDVLIIVKKGRIWITRLLITLTLSLWRLRRTHSKITNRLCLSFYVTDDNLNISKVSLPHDDVYQIYWLNHLIPMYDPSHLYTSVMKANAWVLNYTPYGMQPYELSSRYRVEDTRISKGIKTFFEKVWQSGYGNMIESQAKQIQLAKMKRNTNSLQTAHDTRVVINDSMLKFHENDRREQYRGKWEETWRTYIDKNKSTDSSTVEISDH